MKYGERVAYHICCILISSKLCFGQLKEVAQRPSERYLPSAAVPLMAECLHDFQQSCSCFICHLHTHHNARFTTLPQPRIYTHI